MPKRVDENQKALVADLRRFGASVCHLHELGKGVPDILVGYRGRNYLFELKNPDQPPSKRKLTDDESDWHDEWKGQVDTVTQLGEMLAIIQFKYEGD